MEEKKEKQGSYSSLVYFIAIIIVLQCAIILAYVWEHDTIQQPALELKWWQESVVYQIYPRSFQDSDGDGIGDLRGIVSRLDYLEDLGIGAIWLSPIYPSPMVDFGYDVSNFTDIDPMFGALEDFDLLIDNAHSKGMKVIMDYIPNHSSDKHPWFEASCKGDPTYADYYVWSAGRIQADGSREPPSNWLGTFGGSAWEWNEKRQMFYLHQYTREQPDLNFRNPAVQQEMLDVLWFWLHRGVDGFRVDAIRRLFEVQDLYLDEPRSFIPGATPDQFEYLEHIHTTSLPEVHDMTQEWRKLLDRYEADTGKNIFMVVEVDDIPEKVLRHYDTGADFPFNFNLQKLNQSCDALCLRELVDSWWRNMPPGQWANWVLGSHDVPRISAKMGQHQVSSLNMMLLLLPGTPTTYYGEEIGMLSPEIPFNLTQDPWGVYFGPERYKEFSRDPSRAPMHWDDSENAGFSTAKQTWLPLHPDYRTNNVRAQIHDPSGLSPLQLYKDLTQLRKEPVFSLGNFTYCLTTRDVFSFLRWIPREVTYMVTLNIGKSPATDDYTKVITPVKTDGQEFTLSGQGLVAMVTGSPGSVLSVDSWVDLRMVTLQPGEGAVIKIT